MGVTGGNGYASCDECAAGYFGTVAYATGFKEPSGCNKCPAGKISAAGGACTNCGINYVSAAGDATCTACPSGKVAYSEGSSACTTPAPSMAPTQVYILKVKVPVTQKLTTDLSSTDFMASDDAKTKFAEGIALGLTTGSFTFTKDMIEITSAADGSRRLRRGLTASVLSVNYDIVLQKTTSGLDGADATVQ